MCYSLSKEGIARFPRQELACLDTPSEVFPDDVRIEVDAAKKNGEDNTSQFGVVGWYQDKNSYYFLSIANDGYVAIFTKVEGK